MYWCKNIFLFPPHGRGAAGCAMAGRGFAIFTLFVISFAACKPDIKETGATVKYFDLKAYFKADLARLSKIPQPILKSVTHNGVTESKKVKIDDWTKELSLFSESDINKPAWRDSYNVQQTDHTLIYMAKEDEDDLKTREILINKKTDGSVKYIKIFNYKTNKLYTTKETLTYIPDSIYKIEKTQYVRLLGINKYVIVGRLN